VGPHAPTPQPLPARGEDDPAAEAAEAGDPSGATAGRIARARRSAEELERRARTEFDHARERHASVRLVVQAFESDRRRAGGLLAGGLAYKVFLWQIPLVLFLVSAFGLVVDLAGDDPADVARRTGMTAALASSISQAVAASGSARWWLLILGAFVTIWAGRGVYRGLRLVSELAWDARAPKGNSLKGSLAVTGIGLVAIAMQVLVPRAFSGLEVPGVIAFLVSLSWRPRCPLGCSRCSLGRTRPGRRSCQARSCSAWASVSSVWRPRPISRSASIGRAISTGRWASRS
jgi:hypothetical protein